MLSIPEFLCSRKKCILQFKKDQLVYILIRYSFNEMIEGHIHIHIYVYLHMQRYHRKVPKK